MDLPEQTQRLKFCAVTQEHVAYIFELVNSPGWLRYIGYRGIDSLEQASAYVSQAFQASYETHGFGIWLLCEVDTGIPVGTCGLVNRDYLEGVDLGFAFSPEYCGRGFAFESAQAVIRFTENTLGLSELSAIVMEENTASIKLLEKLGFNEEGMVKVPGVEPNSEEELKLYKLKLNRH